MDRNAARLAHLRGVVCPAAGVTAAAVHGERHAPPAAAESGLLSDLQVREFIANGVLSLPVADLPVALHRAIHAKGEALNDAGKNPGDGIYKGPDGIAELDDLLSAPSVLGALTSLLGAGWAMASHRHMHTNVPAGSPDQQLHKDSQRTKPSPHRPRSLFIFYVPRGATVQMGATAVVNGSPFVSTDQQDWGVVNEAVENLGPGLVKTQLVTPVEQGTIVLAHHGIIHGASARLEDDLGHPWRPMFKFIYYRREDPSRPSWNRQVDEPLAPWEELTSEPSLVPAMESVWQWMCGETGKPAEGEDVAATVGWAAMLVAPAAKGDEAARVGASYQLGRAASAGDAAALEALVGALVSETEGARRAAVHGLQAAGDCAVSALLGVLENADDHETLMSTTDALGEAAVTPSSDVVAAIDVALLKLHALIETSTDLRAWTSGEAQREQWMLEADTAATGCCIALSHIGLRAVAAKDLAVCEQILQTLLPYMRATGPSRGDWYLDNENNHNHGANISGVHKYVTTGTPATTRVRVRSAPDISDRLLLLQCGRGRCGLPLRAP